jgi:hypothetical protein
VLPALLGCGGDHPQERGTRVEPNRTGEAKGPGDSGAPFIEVSADVGLDFEYVNGMSGALYILEIMGAGCGLFDYDNDGDLDLYLVQGHPLPPAGETSSGGAAASRPGPSSGSGTEPVRSPAQEAEARKDDAGGSEDPAGTSAEASRDRDRLYRNDLTVRPDGSRDLHFTDVTDACGIDARGYGMGVATGDYNGDGWVDLYVTNFGANQLWRNDGDGTFTDVTSETGTGDEGWSAGAGFLDYDRDGWLDLFVVDYVEFSLAAHRPCHHTSSALDYCGPGAYEAQVDHLFHNRGDGTFEDVTLTSGIGGARSSGLGVIAADFDEDGWLDIYVANDHDRNFLWINQRDGTFREEGLLRGCAYNWAAEAEASMGIEAADLDGDGHLDLLAAHMDGQTNTFYRNEGAGVFEDRTRGSGLEANAYRHTTYAAAVLDYDNDGRLDVLAVNGAMEIFNLWAAPGDPHPLREPNQLYHNTGGGSFREVSDEAGTAFRLSESSRGADLVYTNNNGPVRVLLNQTGNRNHWIGIRAMDAGGRTDQPGSRVEVTLPSGRRLVRLATTGGSYCSAADPRVLVGLGDRAEPVSVRIRWPDGTFEEWTGLPTDRYTTLHQGSGREVPPPAN